MDNFMGRMEKKYRTLTNGEKLIIFGKKKREIFYSQFLTTKIK